MRLPFSLFFSALLATTAFAQAPDLDRTGGATVGTTTWTLDAGPAAAGQIYGVVLALTEAPTEVFPGVFFEINLDYIDLTTSLPGFFGLLNPSGQASASVTLNEPSFAGLTVSAQALHGPGFDAPSNLVRTTFAPSGTFAQTLGAPLLPIVGGAAAMDANGNLTLAGGTGPVAQRYLADLEEFEDAGLSFGVGLLGVSTALADGRVLFTGGLDTAGVPSAGAAVWDPISGTTTNFTMGTARAGHSATLLGDGRVMIVGGFENVVIDLAAILADPLQALGIFNGVVSSTEFFDPSAGTFTNGPAMLEARALHTATVLTNGKVLVAGGLSLIPIINIPTVSSTAYTYDPSIGIFTFPITFSGGRLGHSAILQSDGSVLLVGGVSIDLAAVIASGDIADLTIGTRDDILRFTTTFFGGSFSNAGTLSESRAGAGVGSLPNGDVLIAGGFHMALTGDLSGLDFGVIASADRYTQGSGAVATGAMTSPRVQPLVEALDDGTMLILGGTGTGAEVYQP